MSATNYDAEGRIRPPCQRQVVLWRLADKSLQMLQID